MDQLERIRASADALRGRRKDAGGVSERDLERARKMRAEGKTWYAVAQELGIEKNATAVRKVLEPEFAAERSERSVKHGKERWAAIRRSPTALEEDRRRQREGYERRQNAKGLEVGEGHGGARVAAARGTPYLGTAKTVYYAKEDSMGNVIDMEKSAKRLAERVDAIASRADAARRRAPSTDGSTTPIDMVDSNGAIMRGNRAFARGIVVQNGGWYHPRGEPDNQYFLCKSVEWMWDGVSAERNVIIAVGILYTATRKSFMKVPYGKVQTYKSGSKHWYEVAALEPGPPFKED